MQINTYRLNILIRFQRKLTPPLNKKNKKRQLTLDYG